MVYTEVLQLPMSAAAYLICVSQERHGVVLKYRHSREQQRALLDHINKAMSDNA
jgi:hypothetical protein